MKRSGLLALGVVVALMGADPVGLPVMPCEIVADGGKIVVRGRKYECTARRVKLDTDKGWLTLEGTDDDPATYVVREGGQGFEIKRARLRFRLSDGLVDAVFFKKDK